MEDLLSYNIMMSHKKSIVLALKDHGRQRKPWYNK